MKRSQLTGRFYIALGIIAFVTFAGLLGPFVFTRYDQLSVVGGLYDEPSGKAWLGSDNLGHDVFTLLMYGTRTSLFVGLISGAIATLIGVLVGTIAGYVGGTVEETLMAATNIVLAIPQLVILVLISVALDSRTATSVAIVIAITSWPWTARAVRAQASSVRTREHLDIARLSGASTFSIILRDVLPYMLSYVVMVFVLQVSSAILAEASLSLLGLGPSNGTSLGMMLHWALAWESVRNNAWWAFVPPTVMLTLVAFGFLLLQSSLDEVFNPRLRRESPRKRRKAAERALAAAAAATAAGRRA
ncbi:MAG: ABC transporter permease [Micromonosporaceae bacterium]|nr:ABC transporter permease [Micromonosporaceae bacterium]